MTNNLSHLKALALDSYEQKLSITDVNPKAVLELIEVIEQAERSLRAALHWGEYLTPAIVSDLQNTLARFEAFKEGKQ